MKTFKLYLVGLFTLFTFSFLSAQVNGISVLNVKTGVISEVANVDGSPAFNPTFSNSGKQIAFDTQGGYTGIMITDLSSGDTYPLEGGEFGNDASWSPDGEYIVFDYSFFGGVIVVVPATGGIPSILAIGVDAEWNNTSEKIVYASNLGLRTINADGTGNTFLTNFGLNPSWSPNGNHVAFTDGNNLWIVDVDDNGNAVSPPYQITFDNGEVYNQQPSWANNSQSLVFHSIRTTDNFDFDIWSVNINTGVITRMAGYAGIGDFDPCYSKNGQYVAFSTTGPASISLPATSATATLHQNFPNPFKTSTTITIDVVKSGNVQLLVFDQLGRIVSVVKNGNMEAGIHEVLWNPSSEGAFVTSGIYTLQMITDEGIQTKQMVLGAN